MIDFILECVLAALPWRVLAFLLGVSLIALAIWLAVQ